MPLPPAHGPNGEVLDLDDEELYRHWAKTLLMNHAGGWSPESIPGKNATAEFEAFVRETQARAIESWLKGWYGDEGITGGPPWWVQVKADERTDAIRNGRLDLSGNRVARST